MDKISEIKKQNTNFIKNILDHWLFYGGFSSFYLKEVHLTIVEARICCVQTKRKTHAPAKDSNTIKFTNVYFCLPGYYSHGISLTFSSLGSTRSFVGWVSATPWRNFSTLHSYLTAALLFFTRKLLRHRTGSGDWHILGCYISRKPSAR